jgi:hypothetical protein
MIRVSICCNNPNNGAFAGIFDGVDFFDGRGYRARLYGFQSRVTYLDNQTRIRLSRRIFQISDWTYGAGNWCWDAFLMSKREGLRLLEYLLEIGFHPEEYDLEGPFVEVIEATERSQKVAEVANG